MVNIELYELKNLLMAAVSVLNKRTINFNKN